MTRCGVIMDPAALWRWLWLQALLPGLHSKTKGICHPEAHEDRFWSVKSKRWMILSAEDIRVNVAGRQRINNVATADHISFYVFSTIMMKFGMWTANAPVLLLLIPCSCMAPGLLLACSHPAPGLLLPWSWSCPPQFGSLHHHQHFTTFISAARAAFYGTVEPRSKALAFKAMFACKAFEEKFLITFCSTFYIGSKEFSL